MPSAQQQSKKKDQKRDQQTGAKGDAEEVTADAPTACFRIVAEITKGIGQQLPKLCLPAKDLQRAQVSRGEPVLVSCGSRSTVAFAEVGGDAGLQVSTAVLESLQALVGSDVTLTTDFSAEEAGLLELSVPDELRSFWTEGTAGLSLEKFVAAVFEDALLMVGDARRMSVNGKTWTLTVLSCKKSNKQASSFGGPWLITNSTKVVIRSSSIAETTADSLPRIGFQRIGGLRLVLDELYEAVKLPLERPDLYRQMGVGPPRGVLLYGPPGTGKTLLARSLAEELRCPVELCSATDLIGSQIGESEARITAMFAACRRRAEDHGAGALLFIDEVDALCPKREDANEAERRMVAAFLTALDGVQGGDRVVVLAATNRPHAIDPALRRAGRLEREIEVGVPNTEERAEILRVHLSTLTHALTEENVLALARRCHGYVGADLRAICLSAARAALRKGEAAVSLELCMDAIRAVPPSALKELLVEVPEVRWDDIGGYHSTKEALKEAVEWPIRYAWAFEAMRMEAPRGVLLYGPPGCSKTMMAKAVATETEMNFVSIKGPELFSKYVGDSERAVREVFRKARLAAPCVIFFDEIDAIGASREGDGGSGVGARVLAQLLAEMDGVSVAGTKQHLVVLAATNRPHVLDSALTRPGRFDRLVHVPLPDEIAREEIFVRQLAKMRTAQDVDANKLAARTTGCSGAEVVMVCREAAVLAIREALDKVGDVQRDAGSRPTDELLPCAEVRHFDVALQSLKPRVDAQTVAFYEDFERRMRQV